jgi:ankyrin repeat protein
MVIQPAKTHVGTVDDAGDTALHLAASSGFESVTRLLIEGGADVMAINCEKETALHRAASSGHSKIVEILLDAGAHVEAEDGKRQTALSRATKNGHDGVIETLVNRGARFLQGPRILLSGSVKEQRHSSGDGEDD